MTSSLVLTCDRDIPTVSSTVLVAIVYNCKRSELPSGFNAVPCWFILYVHVRTYVIISYIYIYIYTRKCYSVGRANAT